MVVTDSDELAEKCRYYKNLCFPLKGARTYMHNDIGFNYRMSNLHAAVGLAQMEKIDEYINRRRKNHSLYQQYLSGVQGINFQPEKEGVKNVYWMNGVVIDKEKFGMCRDEAMRKLKEKGIDTRVFFIGMHRQPALEKFGCYVRGSYPVSEWLAENGFYLPSGSGLTEKQIKYICEIIKRF